MLHSGLVSVTFRQLAPVQIIELATRAGLEGIEWGGDVHVPHGDAQRAQTVCEQTLNAGLKISAYGSYYRVGSHQSPPFQAVLDTAAALRAATIRVWAGDRGSAKADLAYRAQIAAGTRVIAEQAAAQGITISFECHQNTLTDTKESAIRLLRAVDHPSVQTFWQPLGDLSAEDNLATLQAVADFVSNIHVFHRLNSERLSLAGGAERWRLYLKTLAALPGDRYTSLEFVRDDAPTAFLEDAAVLKQWLHDL